MFVAPVTTFCHHLGTRLGWFRCGSNGDRGEGGVEILAGAQM